MSRGKVTAEGRIEIAKACVEGRMSQAEAIPSVKPGFQVVSGNMIRPVF